MLKRLAGAELFKRQFMYNEVSFTFAGSSQRFRSRNQKIECEV
jgi:hypothetical protein